ncbi:hypothetical protein A9Q84_03640 [Halobacteriovorax marinus]|uniref:Nuclease n=1 Tax=Halobacteriovorax marinus TaxID=97084 RepID=A0A1Y5FGS7_9BACT|nr:hypothetical protein A9Q84_03640 [Halobacteriovorax marinus]
MKKTLQALIVLTLSLTANAASNYYPTAYKTKLERGSISGQELKDTLFLILSSTHEKKNGKADTLGCSNGTGKCYSHKVLGYKGARKVLFGKLHLEEGPEGYYVKDVYCRKLITQSQANVGPNIIPNSTVMNCEHSWPQSKFSRRFGKGMQKSDLHHLYPTDSRANSIRGNYEFGNVDNGQDLRNCSGSRSAGHGSRFEPPSEHKGNVARALFYFSVRYKIEISPRQEAVLKGWHIQDPVDAEERERNEGIYNVQQNRNPFIDFPTLVDNIRDF